MAKRNLSSTCTVCGDKVKGGLEGLRWHCDENHSDYYVSNARRFNKKVYFNPMSENWHANYRGLSQELNELNVDQSFYFLEYGREYLSYIYESNQCPTLGNSRNEVPCKQCGADTVFNKLIKSFPAFCGFSCSTKWYADNTDRIEQAMNTMAEKRKADPNYRLTTNQIEYWIRKGFTEADAKKKVTERQSTFTLPKLVAKYGEEEGKERWADRQEKWLTSFLKTKTENGTHNDSMIARKLFDRLSTLVPNLIYGGANEQQFRCGHKRYRVDCYDKKTNRAIEFFGDYWHANPALYESSDVVRLDKSAQFFWDRDSVRLAALKNKGVDVLVIWESDFRKDEDGTHDRCLSYLQSY